VAERFLKKGHSIYLEGRIRKREYEDKEGQKKFIYEILGDTMQMLGSPRGPESNGGPAHTEPSVQDTPVVSGPEDDLPF
jgi:single-strand DNA-binding protein